MPAVCANFLFGSCPFGVRCRNIHNLSSSNQYGDGGLPAPIIGLEQTSVQIPSPTNRLFTQRTRPRRPPFSTSTRLDNEDTLPAAMDFTSVRIPSQNRNGPRTRLRPTPPGPVQLKLQNTNEVEPQRLKSATSNIDISQKVSKVSHENIMKQCIEDELRCDICLENYIKPTVLNCSHTFCHYCIEVWARRVNQCPSCRKHITNMAHCRSLDSFLERIIQYLPEGIKSRRESLKIERNNNLADGFLMDGRDGGESNNVVRARRGLTRRYYDGGLL